MTTKARDKFRGFWSNLPMAMIIVEGVSLLLATSALVVATVNLGDQVKLNRSIGCISRYLDHQEYAPACERYVREFKQSRK